MASNSESPKYNKIESKKTRLWLHFCVNRPTRISNWNYYTFDRSNNWCHSWNYYWFHNNVYKQNNNSPQ